MTRHILFLLLASMLVLGGCGKSRSETKIEKAIESQTGGEAKVDLDKQKMTIMNKDGDKMEFAGGEEGIKVPADFPKDVYVYSGAKVDASLKTKDGYQLQLTTADPAAKVVETYQAELKKNGWEEKTASQAADFSMVEYQKKDQSVTVTAATEGKQTHISIILAKEEAPSE